MHSVSDVLRAFVLRAALFSAGAMLTLLLFIAIRRVYRGRTFAALDRHAMFFRGCWGDLVIFRVPVASWRNDRMKRSVIERLVLDEIENCSNQSLGALQEFIRQSGLMELRVWQASYGSRNQQKKALIALGRSRLPEFIPLLSEAIESHDVQIQDAAVRALGQIGTPEAARTILRRAAEAALNVSELTIKDALLRTCHDDPRALICFLDIPTIQLLIARVLGEVADNSVADELILMSKHSDPEMRACSARGLAHTEALFAISALSLLATDDVWFVRLRAVSSLAKLKHPGTMGALLITVTDSNRTVRQRSAAALAQLGGELLPQILDRIASTGDKYALHAFISELDRNGECKGLMLRLPDKQALISNGGRDLLEAVQQARREIAQKRSSAESSAEAVVGHA